MMSLVLLDQVNLTNGTTELALSNVVSVEVVVVPCLYTLIDDHGVTECSIQDHTSTGSWWPSSILLWWKRLFEQKVGNVDSQGFP